MISVAIALAVAADQFPDFKPNGRWAKSTDELAAELLAPEQAADAVSHSFGLPIFQDGAPSSVRFFGRPRLTSDGFCQRRHYYISIFVKGGKGEGEPQPPIIGDDIRLGDCDGLFAHVNPGADLDAAKRTLRWLEWAQTTARSNASLPFRISCKSETEEDRCSGGARNVLAGLPLDKTSIIADAWRRPPHNWDVSVVETSPGQLFWQVEIDATPGRSSIDLAWRIPPPF